MTIENEEAQLVLASLIEWEMLGQEHDLKILLRSMSLADLSVVHANIQSIPGALERYVCARLVGLELQYRLGTIKEWGYKRDGFTVDIHFTPTTGPQYITLNIEIENFQ